MSRRFIAGAICPDCGAMDKLYLEAPSTTPVCAACGYEMQSPESEHPEPIVSKSTEDKAVTLVNFKNK
ncbi:MAG: YheV family putative metal-binding protein [Pseudomonadales bacterium]|nr:YheV family putative metal-binding protein [Pseudomonadales bacterium]